MKILKYTGYGPDSKSGAWAEIDEHAIALTHVRSVGPAEVKQGIGEYAFAIYMDASTFLIYGGKAEYVDENSGKIAYGDTFKALQGRRNEFLRAVLEAQGVETD